MITGGFRLAAEPAPATGVLVIFFSTDLERDFDRVQELGASRARTGDRCTCHFLQHGS